MKIFVSTFPYVGHFNPTRPVVEEMLRRGHEVLWMTAPRFKDKAEATGATYVEMKPDALISDAVIGPPDPKEIIAWWRTILLDRIQEEVRDYRAALADFPADVMMVDFATFGARCLYELTGLPYVTLGTIPYLTLDPEVPPWHGGGQPPKTFLGRLHVRFQHLMAKAFFYRPLTAAWNDQRKKLGLAPHKASDAFLTDWWSPMAHVVMTDKIFEFPRKYKPSAKFVGPLIPDFTAQEGEEPGWWGELLAHPRDKVVHITQGTIATNLDNLVKPTIRALADRDDLLIVVTGNNLDDMFLNPDTPNADGRIARPANVRTHPFIPHPKLLPHVGVMITNAGYNGVLTALTYSVPLVCAGTTEDKAVVSERVQWSGTGINLRTDTPSEKAIRDAVVKVSEDPSFARNAERIGASFKKHDGAKEVVDVLETVAKDPSTWMAK